MLLVATLLLLLPAGADAHGIIGRSDGTLFYTSADPGTTARLLVFSRTRGTVDFLDTRSPGGIDWGPCVPITERRARCRTRGIRRIRVEVYDGDDFVRSSAAVPLSVTGGSGDDVIRGGYGDDDLDGGSGNDTVSGGPGEDLVDGSAGDDVLQLRDGSPDTVRCEDGQDRAALDTSDEAGLALFLDCEERSTADPPPDVRPPRVFVRVPLRQALDSLGLQVGVAMNEPGTVIARGRIFIDGRRGPLLDPATARPNAPHQRWSPHLGLNRAARLRVQAALNRRQKVVARVWAVGADSAGNRGRATTRTRVVG